MIGLCTGSGGWYLRPPVPRDYIMFDMHRDLAGNPYAVDLLDAYRTMITSDAPPLYILSEAMAAYEMMNEGDA